MEKYINLLLSKGLSDTYFCFQKIQKKKMYPHWVEGKEDLICKTTCNPLSLWQKLERRENCGSKIKTKSIPWSGSILRTPLIAPNPHHFSVTLKYLQLPAPAFLCWGLSLAHAPPVFMAGGQKFWGINVPSPASLKPVTETSWYINASASLHFKWKKIWDVYSIGCCL